MRNNYFLSNILNVYYDEKCNYDKLFRYVTTKELVSLLSNKCFRFTKPSLWTHEDEFETYFEEWWLNKSNLTIWINNYIDRQTLIYSKVGVDFNLIWRECATVFVDYILRLSSASYCYCLTKNWISSKKEHHEKWNKHILISFKKDFWKRLAVCSEKIDFNCDYLYADIFSMQYIGDFNRYIDECSVILNKDILINKILNTGPFLKHIKYFEEQEVRIKLNCKFKECVIKYNCSELLLLLNSKNITNKMQFVDLCWEFIFLARELYLDKLNQIPNIKSDGYFYLNFPQNISAMDIIETITLSESILIDDKEIVLQLANKEHIKVVENRF